MQLILLWDHHCLDGVSEEIFKHGFYKFNLEGKKKRNFFKTFINKIQKNTIEKEFILDISQDNFDILYSLFNKTNDFFTEFLIICPKENLQHFGYFCVKKNKEITFFPVSKATNEEVFKRDKDSEVII